MIVIIVSMSLSRNSLTFDFLILLVKNALKLGIVSFLSENTSNNPTIDLDGITA